MAGPQYYWVGDLFDWTSATATDPSSDLMPALSLDLPKVGNLDTVSRVVVDYTFTTQIEGTGSGLEKQPEPWAAAVWYTPLPPGDPDDESGSVIDAMIGDALWSELLQWTPVVWTDGSIFGYQWHAHSGQPMSQKGQRVIHDKTTAKIHFGIMSMRDVVPDESQMIPLELRGFMRVKVLIKRF